MTGRWDVFARATLSDKKITSTEPLQLLKPRKPNLSSWFLPSSNLLKHQKQACIDVVLEDESTEPSTIVALFL